MKTSAPRRCSVCGGKLGHRSTLANKCFDCLRREVFANLPKPERKPTPAYKLTRPVSRHGVTVPNVDIAKGNHRSQALRDSAKGEACVACGRNDGTTVWAHSNEGAHGKGKSLKCHDLLGLYLCSVHHAWLDCGPATREEKQAFFREHYPATMVRVAEKLASGALKL